VDPFRVETYFRKIANVSDIDKIHLDNELNKRLTKRQRDIYDLMQYDKELTGKERRGKRGEHCTGFTQVELAEMFNVTHQMISLEIGNIKVALRDIVDAEERKRHEAASNSKRVCEASA
jgi:hypothetical protein